MPTIEFWFDFASTYSCLSALRAEKFCAAHGVKIVWRAFLLGPIFKMQGWSTSPFVLYPAKGDYMWLDFKRQATKYRLAVSRPESFPQNGLFAARMATAAEHEPWLSQFVRSVFELEFVQGQDISKVEVVQQALSGCGADVEEWTRRATTDSIKEALRARTAAAVDQGIFGAPTFVTHGEMFWGDDRLEDAVAFACANPV